MGSSTEEAAAFTFECVPGYFRQSDPDTDPHGFDPAKENFGLIAQRFATDDATTADWPAWRRFHRYVHHLNSEHRASGVSYRVLYFGRHGEGYHNQAETQYGAKAWNEYWSRLDGDGTVTWFDAHLTEAGEQQAEAAHRLVEAQLLSAAMPPPESYYVSPLHRCLQTAYRTWSRLAVPGDPPRFAPVVKELLREVLGEHTCDRRRTRSHIARAFPACVVEDGFSEHDLLWRADHRETHREHDARTRDFLTDVFSRDANAWLSLTSHSGTLASHLRVLGHRPFPLPTGGMIPILVKATRLREASSSADDSPAAASNGIGVGEP